MTTNSPSGNRLAVGRSNDTRQAKITGNMLIYIFRDGKNKVGHMISSDANEIQIVLL